MPARFVTTSLVTKRVGIAARFVTFVKKRAVVTKRAATSHASFKDVGVTRGFASSASRDQIDVSQFYFIVYIKYG